MRICLIPGCGKKHKGHGFCDTHLARIQRGGSAWEVRKGQLTEEGRRRLRESKLGPNNPNWGTAVPTEQKFWEKVNKSGPNGCWVWTASLNKGYGWFKPDRYSHPVSAHRFSYQLLIGAVPSDLDLHHICANRACVNPDHLQVKTRYEHMLEDGRLERFVDAGGFRKAHR